MQFLNVYVFSILLICGVLMSLESLGVQMKNSNTNSSNMAIGASAAVGIILTIIFIVAMVICSRKRHTFQDCWTNKKKEEELAVHYVIIYTFIALFNLRFTVKCIVFGYHST